MFLIQWLVMIMYLNGIAKGRPAKVIEIESSIYSIKTVNAIKV